MKKLVTGLAFMMCFPFLVHTQGVVISFVDLSAVVKFAIEEDLSGLELKGYLGRIQERSSAESYLFTLSEKNLIWALCWSSGNYFNQYLGNKTNGL